jgi:16S rRNA (guanine966-N2)-methyltransferase
LSGLRVIGGKAKGLKLRMVPGRGVRPIGDRVKESLFNIVGEDIRDSRFLDVFAGTGGVGIEALSRGAAHAVFLEINLSAVETIEFNLIHTHLVDHAQIHHLDAFAYLEGDAHLGYDYVYIAPPQYENLWEKAVETLDIRTDWLNPDAWVIAQIHPREYFELRLNNLVEFDQRRYGSTMLVFYILPES